MLYKNYAETISHEGNCHSPGQPTASYSETWACEV